MELAGFDFLGATDDTDGAPDDAVKNPEAETEAVEADDVTDDGAQDESTDSDDDETEDEGEELEVIDLDGEEVTLAQIREWKRGTLREQDYTKKTQELAVERKTLESKLSEITGIADAISASEADIKKMLVADLDDIDLKSLRDSDYSEYLKVKETIKERHEQFDKLKEIASTARKASMAEEQASIVELLGWSDSGKQAKDVEAYKAFAKEAGFNDRDGNSITSAKVMKAIIELAHLKKASQAEPKKPALKKVKFKTSSSSKSEKTKPKGLSDRVDNFFSGE